MTDPPVVGDHVLITTWRPPQLEYVTATGIEPLPPAPRVKMLDQAPAVITRVWTTPDGWCIAYRTEGMHGSDIAAERDVQLDLLTLF